MSKPVLVAIGGPTASGKSALAIEVARHFGAPIISADSRQLYAEMRIGTARMQIEEWQGIPHYFMGSHSIFESFDVRDFELGALALLGDVFQAHPVCVVCGGTGLYLRALTEGLHNLPSDEEIRQQLNEELAEKGLIALAEEAAARDAAWAKSADLKNPVRVLRALEVMRIANLPLTALRQQQRTARSFTTLGFTVNPGRERLYANINARTSAMLRQGLEEEARALYPYAHLTALQTVGYSEWFDVFSGKLPLQDAEEIIARNTRRYAKRQLTWFTNQTNYLTINPHDKSEIIKSVEGILGNEPQPPRD